MPIISRRVHVYETDMMGIVHHSNYLRFCEEARVVFCEKMQLLALGQKAQSDSQEKLTQVSSLAVIHAKLNFIKAMRFHDQFEIFVQGRQDGIRLILQYKIKVKRDSGDEIVATAETHHCRVEYTDSNSLRVLRPSKDYLQKTKELPWTETWL